MKAGSNCIVCGTRLRGRQTHFCSIACKNNHHQSYTAQQRRGLARKLDLVRRAGGRCSVCGYNRNLAALVFHHTGAERKRFKLDLRSLSNRTLASLLAEVRTCVLVCHNCHAELHNPRLKLDSLR